MILATFLIFLNIFGNSFKNFILLLFYLIANCIKAIASRIYLKYQNIEQVELAGSTILIFTPWMFFLSDIREKCRSRRL